MTKIVLTGGSGLLGTELQKLNTYIAPPHQAFDLLNVYLMRLYLSEIKPDLVLHAAALTGLGRCDKEKKDAYNINAMGTKSISSICKSLNIQMIYMSTDYVFDGTKGMYSEKDIPNPMNYYAKTKWIGEAFVQGMGQKIIRTSFKKSPWPHNVAFTNKFTSCQEVADVAKKIDILTHHYIGWDGILHVGGPRISFYDLAMKSNENVKPAYLERFNDYGIPLDTSLDCSKSETFIRKIA